MSAYRRPNRSSRSTAQQTTSGPNNDTSTASSINESNGNPSNRTNHLDDNGDGHNSILAKYEIDTIHDSINDNATMYTLQPKHIQFPDVPYNSELLNELLVFLFALLATGMQFLHLYRTVWWLPESNTSQAMNFYLIDEHLTIFIVILLGRRFFYCLIMRVLQSICSKNFQSIILKMTRLIYFVGVLSILGLLCYQMYSKHEYIVIYLCYPLLVYLIVFGLKIEPFLRTIFESKSSTYFNGIPTHSCSTNSIMIRTEIDVLSTDYKNRCEQIVFTALMNAYYAAFIPCCFAQSYLHYDIYLAAQHLGFMLLGGLTMCTIFCFPANYCDVLHKASLHLGTWKKASRVESRAAGASSTIAWSKQTIWSPGSFVRYSGISYKSSGIVITAIPVNGAHNRFYLFFQNPANIYLVLSIAQSLIIILQVIILFMVIEWHNIISLSYLLLVNYHTLFRIVRDFLISQRTYAEETAYLERAMIN